MNNECEYEPLEPYIPPEDPLPSDAKWGGITGNIENQEDLIQYIREHGGGGGTKNYNELNNKPQINDIVLQGNKSADDLDLVSKSRFLNTLYPTGSVVITYNKVNPSTYIGGVWELVEEEYYPIATVKDTIDEQTERFKEAGLPNITGNISLASGTYSDYPEGSGAFYDGNKTTNKWGSGSYNQKTRSIKFDASKSNDIYGKSDTVTPKSVLVYIWRRTDNGILTYNFVNISFNDSDFKVDEEGRISLKNTQYTYTKDMLVSANDTGTLISTSININDIVLKTRKIANISLDHDITEQEIQNAIKDIEAELNNKTINADDNTILNLATDNFKDGEVRTSVRDGDTADDKHLVTEKAVRDAIIEAVTGLFNIKGNKSTIAEILALTGSEDYEAWTCSEDGNLYYWLTDKWLNFPLIDIDDFVKYIDKENIIYGNGNDKKQLGYDVINTLKEHYYYKWEYIEQDPPSSTIYYTKTIEDGTNIDIYEITFENNKVKTITLSSVKGTLDNGMLIIDNTGYEHIANGDGLYIINSDKKVITTEALNDLLNLSGKVQDVQVDGVSIVENKVANIDSDTDAIDDLFNDLPDTKDLEIDDLLSDDTDYTDNPQDTDTLSKVDITNKKVKSITFDNLWLWIKGKITSVYYPVGHIIIRTDNTNPGTVYGGTWQIIAENRVLWGVGASTNAGTTLSEQLPNIKGEASQELIGTCSWKGALSSEMSGSANRAPVYSGGQFSWGKINFNASKSNSVYTDNGIVRPNAYTVHFWRRTA